MCALEAQARLTAHRNHQAEGFRGGLVSEEGTSDSCFSKLGIQEESISLGPLTTTPPPTHTPGFYGHKDTQTNRLLSGS